MSASTSGEERFNNPRQIEDEDQLKSGLVYNIIIIKKSQGNKISNLKVHWESFRKG
jgi:hypothetical protein